MSWIVFLTTVFVLAFPAWAQEGTITIKRTYVEKKHVDVTIEYKPVDPSDQIHVFVDDVFVKAVSGTSRISVDLEHLEPGNHIIDLRDATRDHQVRGGCKRVRVTISSTGTRSLPQGGGGEECKP